MAAGALPHRQPPRPPPGPGMTAWDHSGVRERREGGGRGCGGKKGSGGAATAAAPPLRPLSLLSERVPWLPTCRLLLPPITTWPPSPPCRERRQRRRKRQRCGKLARSSDPPPAARHSRAPSVGAPPRTLPHGTGPCLPPRHHHHHSGQLQPRRQRRQRWTESAHPPGPGPPGRPVAAGSPALGSDCRGWTMKTQYRPVRRHWQRRRRQPGPSPRPAVATVTRPQ